MRLSHLRSLMLLALSFLLAIVITACGGSRSSLPENLPNGTYAPDPLFEQFYEQHGGFDLFGFGISTLFSDQTGKKFQYFETVLMVYDPILDRVSFEAIGTHLGLQNLPVPTWTGGSLDEGLLVGEFFIHPAFVSLYLKFGPELVGQPLTQPFMNLSRNHVEQHFQNLGMYFLLDDEEQTAGLLEYGRLDCNGCQPQYYLGERAGIIQPPLTDISFYHMMEEKQITVSLTGEVVRRPSLIEDGSTDLAFENLVLYKENGELKIRPVPVLLGLGDEFLYPPLQIDGLVFYDYGDGYGHNVLAVFEQYIRLNGGIEVSGRPITEIKKVNQETNQYRQCFENYCLDFFENAPTAKVRPAPLGHQYLEHATPNYVIPQESLETSNKEYTTQPRNKNPFTMNAWENHTVVNSSTPQTIYVSVSLENTPQPNKELVLKVIYPDGAEITIKMPATGEDGMTGITLEPIAGQNGELVFYEACLYLPNAEPACVQQSFLIWGNP